MSQLWQIAQRPLSVPCHSGKLPVQESSASRFPTSCKSWGGNIGTNSYSPGFPLDSCPAQNPWEAQAPKETPVTTAQRVCTQQVEEKGQFSAACLGLAAPSKNLVSPVWTRQQAPAGCTGVSPGAQLPFWYSRSLMRGRPCPGPLGWRTGAGRRD